MKLNVAALAAIAAGSVALFAGLQALAAVIGAEQPIDDSPPVPARYDQLLPAVASDGTNFLVVWAEALSATTHKIMAARVNAAGEVPDKTGLLQVAASSAGTQTEPAVAFDGTNYLVVWQDRSRSSSAADIYGARVSPAGEVLDPYGFEIARPSATGRYNISPTVSFDGANYLVAWQENVPLTTPQNRIWGAVVRPNATIAVTAFQISETATTTAISPQTAFDGSNHLVVWQDSRSGNADIYGARVQPSGTLLDTVNLALVAGTGSQNSPALAFGGTSYLLSWMNGLAIDAQFVTPAGTAAGTVINLAAAAGRSPSVAFDGTSFLVAWWKDDGSSDVVGRRVRTDGTLPDASELALAVSSSFAVQPPSVGAMPGRFLVAWDDSRTAPRNVWATRVLGDSTVQDPNGLLVSLKTPSQGAPIAAFDGTNFLAVWSENRDGGTDLFARRFQSDGSPVGTSSSIVNRANSQSVSAVAFNGTNYLVVYTEGNASSTASWVMAALVSPTGAVINPAIDLNSGGSYGQGPSVAAAANGDFLVVWSDDRTGPNNWRVYAARVANDGTVLDPTGIPVTSAVSRFPSVASDGTDFAVVWEGPSATAETDIYAARISASGVVLDSTPLRLTTAAGYDSNVDIAYGAGRYLAAWRGYDPNFYDVKARSFFADAGLGNLSWVTNAPSDQINVDVAFDGSNFILVWRDSRNYITTSKLILDDIYGARVRPDGTVLDNAGVAIVRTPAWNEGAPHLAKGAGKFMFLTYAKNASPYSNTGSRAFFRGVTLNEAPVANNRTVTLNQDTPTNVSLLATDADWDAFSWTIVTQPASGTLSGTGANRTYTPNSGFFGTDTFSWKVNDGAVDSNVATVTLNVTRANTAPVANGQTVQATEDTPRAITLSATDAENDPLTYTVVNQPFSGTLSGTGANLTYTPAANMTGSDSFTFRVNDGFASSNTATVFITVSAVNDPPVAQPQSVTTSEDTPLTLTLVGADPDNTSLTYVPSTVPNGSLTGNGGPTWTFTPAANFNGNTSFTFTVSDGTATSQAATVGITVTSVNDRPTATAQQLATTQGGTLNLTLAGTDADGDNLSFAIATQPSAGTLSGTAPNLVYSPANGFRGQTTFTFTANDGAASSQPATVTIDVVNVLPVVTAAAEPQQAQVGQTVQLIGTASDVGGDPLSYQWGFGDGSTGATTLTASHAWAAAGTYTVTFSANDGAGSNSATATVTVLEAITDAGSGGGAGGGSGGGTGGGGGSDTEDPSATRPCGCAASSGSGLFALLGLAQVFRRRARSGASKPI